MQGHELLETIAGLTATPAVAAVMRHAARHPIANPAEPTLAEITADGAKAAAEFGARLTGFDSLFEQVGCGLVVDYGDVAQLAHALALLEDAGLRQRLGQAARRAYEQAYSWDKMASRLANLYQDLV